MLLFSAGGVTQKKSAPDVSEAGLMRECEYTKADQFPEFMLKVFTENDFYTTLQHIKNASEVIRRQLCIADGCITIFCEAMRAANVIMIARHFMGDLVDSIDDITVETASWERADPFKQVRNLIYNKLAIKYPWLGLADREHRKCIRRSVEI